MLLVFFVLRFGQSPTLREQDISLGNAIDLRSHGARSHSSNPCVKLEQSNYGLVGNDQLGH